MAMAPDSLPDSMDDENAAAPDEIEPIPALNIIEPGLNEVKYRNNF